MAQGQGVPDSGGSLAALLETCSVFISAFVLVNFKRALQPENVTWILNHTSWVAFSYCASFIVNLFSPTVVKMIYNCIYISDLSLKHHCYLVTVFWYITYGLQLKCTMRVIAGDALLFQQNKDVPVPELDPAASNTFFKSSPKTIVWSW